MLTTARHARLTIGLIAINLLVFGYQSTLTAEQADLFLLRWSAIPVEIIEGDLEPMVPFPIAGTLLSSLFLHADVAHLAANMALLALFGARIERLIGGPRTLGLYLAAGVAGGLAHIAASPLSLALLLGASGAIAGLMGASLVLTPRSAPHTLVFIAWATIQAATIADDLLGAGRGDGGLAVWSHLAGLLVGLAAAALWRRATGRLEHVEGAKED